MTEIDVDQSNNNLSEKLAQFDEFFSIEHHFNINVNPVDSKPSFEQFMQNMPLPFKMASEMVSLDHSALKPLQGINSSNAIQLIEYLNHQSQKIDLLMGYIIKQQDDEALRFQGIKFGGGGLIFTGKSLFTIGQWLELKIFLSDSHAVYCLGEVIELSHSVSNNDSLDNHSPNNKEQNTSQLNDYKVVFHYINEEDREILVRSSLQEQAKLLQALAKQRNQDKSREE